MKIAVLDDYLRLSQSVADWSPLAKTCDITVFDRPLALPDEAARVLEPFDMPAVRTIVRDAAPNDYRWSSLITGVVHSVPFQMRRAR